MQGPMSNIRCIHVHQPSNIDVETCRACGGSAKVIACIEDPVVIRKILNHLQEKSSLDLGVRIHNPRAPPQASLFS
jgi:hypothetical protein